MAIFSHHLRERYAWLMPAGSEGGDSIVRQYGHWLRDKYHSTIDLILSSINTPNMEVSIVLVIAAILKFHKNVYISNRFKDNFQPGRYNIKYNGAGKD